MSAVTPPLPPIASPVPAVGPADAGSRARGPDGELAMAPGAWLRRWWPLCLGLAILIASTSVRFAANLWQLPEFEHGPLLLAVALWLLWSKKADILGATPPASPVGASTVLATGLLIYLLGVRLKAGYFEFGSLAIVLAGALCLIGGWKLVRSCAFALVFIVLASPMPAPIIFAATSGLKEWVSVIAEAVLHLAGYPVARDGVTLRMGPYNLLLADACSGMNSLISLTAVGLLYIYLTARRALWHTALLVAAIIPVAVATNIVRVLILMLITYHLGDEAGQGFLHEFAGFVLFLGAVVILAGVDLVLARIARRAGRARGPHAA
jgi:exosortase B